MARFMKNTRVTAGVLFAMAIVTASSLARLAETDGSFDLSWNTVDGGGGTSTGGSFELSGTIGQPDASIVAMSGGVFEIAGGFWPGAGPEPVDPCPADVAPAPNGDGVVNVSDLLAVINGWGPCPAPCPPHCQADVNDDCVVNVSDLLAVINAWGLCP